MPACVPLINKRPRQAVQTALRFRSQFRERRRRHVEVVRAATSATVHDRQRSRFALVGGLNFLATKLVRVGVAVRKFIEHFVRKCHDHVRRAALLSTGTHTRRVVRGLALVRRSARAAGGAGTRAGASARLRTRARGRGRGRSRARRAALARAIVVLTQGPLDCLGVLFLEILERGRLAVLPLRFRHKLVVHFLQFRVHVTVTRAQLTTSVSAAAMHTHALELVKGLTIRGSCCGEGSGKQCNNENEHDFAHGEHDNQDGQREEPAMWTGGLICQSFPTHGLCVKLRGITFQMSPCIKPRGTLVKPASLLR